MTVTSARLPSTPTWRGAVLTIAAVWLALLLVHWRTLASMVSIWSRSDTFAHGFLVLPISLWLVWRLRAPLGEAAIQPRPSLLALVALAALAWMLADVAEVNAGSQFALVAMLILAVPAVLGTQVAHTILFPLLFLLFAVPFGEFLLPSMMEWTADFVVLALRFVGIPVFREGLMFVIPTGTWSVIDECSGVRYLIASFMVGTLFAYLNYRSYKRRAVFMLVSLGVPIVANWLRAFIIVMMGHLSGNKIAVGVDHILYGWVFFGIVIMIMFVIGSRWSEADAQGVAVAGGSDGSLARPASRASAAVLPVALATLAVASAPVVYVWALDRAEAGAANPVVQLPDQWSSWTASSASITNWTPKITNPPASVSRTFVGPAGSVGVHVAYYREQSEGRKLVSSQNVLIGLNDRDWMLRWKGGRQLAGGSFRVAELVGRHALTSDKPQHLVVWRTYWVGGRFVAGDVAAKVAGTFDRLLWRGDDGALVILYADEGSVAASQAAVEAFVTDNLSGIEEVLRRAREAR